jgi:hypothetical protein
MAKVKKVKISTMEKAVPASNPSLPALQQLQDSGKKANLNSGQTRRNYNGYMRRGRQWLAGHFSEDTNVPRGLEQDELPSPHDDMYQDPDFKNAFNERPNKYSHQALALFISFKCFHQNLKAGTGTGIHAAFKKYWEQL